MPNDVDPDAYFAERGLVLREERNIDEALPPDAETSVRPSLLLRGRVFAARRKGVAAGFVLEACGDDTLRVNRHKVLRSGADAWFSRFRPA